MNGGLPKLLLVAITALASFMAAAPRQAGKQQSTSFPANPTATDKAEALRLNNLGAAYMGQQRFADAAKMFHRAIALDLGLFVARLNEAIAQVNDQKVDPAREALLAIVGKDPDNSRAWYNLGLLYKGVGQAKEALEAFEQAAKLSPEDADAQYFVGSTAAQLQLDDKAIAAFERTLKLNPYHASAVFGLARVYQHLGNQEEARKYLAKFQQLTQSKLGVPMSLAYGEQGALSLAVQARAELTETPPAIPVTFTPLSGESGISSTSRPETSAGVCVLDYDGDGLPDLWTGTSLYHNTGNGKFENTSKKAGFVIEQGGACAAADYDNDGHTDLALVSGGELLLYRNQGDGAFKDVNAQAGLAKIVPAQTAMGLTWVDFDHDGDVDLYVTVATAQVSASSEAKSGGSNVLLRNNGNGTFTNWTAETALTGSGVTFAAVGTDYNNDRAVDLLVTGTKTELYTNPREGKWPSTSDLPAGSIGVAVLDFDKNSWMDLALTQNHAPGLALLQNLEGKKWEPVPLPDLHWARAWGVAAFDYDNDGWIDIAALGETADGHAELRVLRNEGAKGFRDASKDVGAEKLELHNPRQIVAADLDADGDEDLLVTGQTAPLLLLRNDGGNSNQALRVDLKGLNDNKSAIGAKVEIYAGDLYQKFEVTGAAWSSQSVNGLLVGLGRRKQVDVVRILWPTGVAQDEIELAAGKTAHILEIDRRGSSCPVLFAWDGTRYRFITDMLGAGVLGHWIAPATRNIPDPTEYVKIEDFVPHALHGRLSFRLMEPMEEVVYIDQLRLLAIDHPADIAVYPNEYFASNPPYPPFKIVTSRQPHPLQAWDNEGRDVSELLRARDHRYVNDMERLPFAGFTKPHKLELDLGEPYAGGPLRLLMSGYIEYFTATSMYAADQARLAPFAPYLEALRPDGKWVRVLDDMGFPAGLPRTITVDLTGKLPAGTRRVRLTTNLQIYWDQMLVDRSASAADQAVVRIVPLASARLGFHGYPRAEEGSTPGDLAYSYENASATGPYSREIGAYTRPGDITALLRSVDDKFAIFGSGEELAVEFDPASLPPLSAGWKRDYFFFAHGYEKDMDFYAADPNTVDPLPFGSMGVYPPSRCFPDDAEHTRYRLEYNTRFVSRPEPPSFRYHYSPARK